MDIALPQALLNMLRDGTWATVGAQVDERIATAVATQWDPQSVGIHLEKPVPLSEDLRRSPGLGELWNLSHVDPERCIVIGDFGIGSDNPIVIDFSEEPPPVKTQQWTTDDPSAPPNWITIASTFDEFLGQLGLS